MTDYRIELPAFSGPLELLLHLVEREELDITAISLVRVTEQYLRQVEQLEQNRIDHLIDFLVVAARLLLIKSRALLPQPAAVSAEEEEEDPAEALLRQLRLYKRYKRAAAWLRQRNERGLRTYLRVAAPPKIERRLDLSGITAATLLGALQQALERATTLEESVGVVRPNQLTIDKQIVHLRETLKRRERVSFQELLSARSDRVEVAVTLLAILELIKRREVTAHQPYPFGPIEIVPTAASARTTIAGPVTPPKRQS